MKNNLRLHLKNSNKLLKATVNTDESQDHI